jgi:hypothetical protein
MPVSEAQNKTHATEKLREVRLITAIVTQIRPTATMFGSAEHLLGKNVYP